MLEIFDLDMRSAHRSEKSVSFAWLSRLYELFHKCLVSDNVQPGFCATLRICGLASFGAKLEQLRTVCLKIKHRQAINFSVSVGRHAA